MISRFALYTYFMKKNYNNPPLPTNNDDEKYVDPQLEDLQQAQKDTEQIKNYTEPYLQTLREKEKIKNEGLVEQTTDQIHRSYAKNTVEDSTIASNLESHTTIWKKGSTTPQSNTEVAASSPKKEGLGTKILNWFKGGSKKAIMTGTFVITGLAATAEGAQTKGEDPKDSTTQKTLKYENPKKNKADQSTKESAIPLYTTSNTIEGAITPTGFNNSFFENEYGISPEDIDTLAQKHGFRTGSAGEFQSDLIDYVEAHHPEVIDSVLNKYGDTKFAKETRKQGVAGLKDGKLGVRTAFIMSTLKEVEQGTSITLEPVPEKEDNLEGGVETSGADVFNTDGYTSLDILFDVSPSMAQHKAFLAEKLKGNTSDIPVNVIGFTDDINETKTFNTPSEASEYLKTIPLVDNNTELLLQTLEKKLQSMDKKVGGKGKIVGLTDELLQKVSQSTLDSLQKLSVEKNVDLSFTVMVGEETYTLSLDDVQHAFDEIYNAQVLPEIQTIDAGIAIRTNQIAEWQEELKNTTDKSTIKNLKKSIEENESEISSFKERKQQKELVDIANFKSTKTNDLVNK